MAGIQSTMTALQNFFKEDMDLVYWFSDRVCMSFEKFIFQDLENFGKNVFQNGYGFLFWMILTYPLVDIA